MKIINIPEKNCVNCDCFTWWDGDFCCSHNLRLLQESPDGEFNDNIFMAIKINKDCGDWREYDNGTSESSYVKKFNEFLKLKNDE